MRDAYRAWIIVGALTFTGPRAAAADADSRISLEFSAGFVSGYDDSGLWDNGYTAGATGLWWASESVHLGVALGLTSWSYQPEQVVDDLVPPGANLVVEQSTGDLQIVELVPCVRWEHDESLPLRLGFFLQGGAGLAYVKTFALSDVLYETGGGPQQANRFEINESDVNLEGVASAGFTRPVSTTSWLELFSSYRAVIMDETVDLLSLSIGFRVQL
jgi:hypothetical protein